MVFLHSTVDTPPHLKANTDVDTLRLSADYQDTTSTPCHTAPSKHAPATPMDTSDSHNSNSSGSSSNSNSGSYGSNTSNNSSTWRRWNYTHSTIT